MRKIREKGLKTPIFTGSFPVRFRRSIHDNIFTQGQVWLGMTSSFLATLFGNPVANSFLSRPYNTQVKNAFVFLKKSRSLSIGIVSARR